MVSHSHSNPACSMKWLAMSKPRAFQSLYSKSISITPPVSSWACARGGVRPSHTHRVHCCFAGGTTYTHHVRREQIVVGDYDLGWVLGRRLGQPLDFACQCRLQSNEQRA